MVQIGDTDTTLRLERDNDTGDVWLMARTGDEDACVLAFTCSRDVVQMSNLPDSLGFALDEEGALEIGR